MYLLVILLYYSSSFFSSFLISLLILFSFQSTCLLLIEISFYPDRKIAAKFIFTFDMQYKTVCRFFHNFLHIKKNVFNIVDIMRLIDPFASLLSILVQSQAQVETSWVLAIYRVIWDNRDLPVCFLEMASRSGNPKRGSSIAAQRDKSAGSVHESEADKVPRFREPAQIYTALSVTRRHATAFYSKLLEDV